MNRKPREVLEAQESFYRSGMTRSVPFRQEQLEKLKAALIEEQASLAEALREGLGKPGMELLTSELGYLLAEIRSALRG